MSAVGGSGLLALRPYQEEGIEAVRAGWGRGIRRLAMVLPTGAGKTVVFAHIVKAMHDLGVVSLVLAHRDELIEQAVAKLRATAPGLRVGVVKAARRELTDVDAIVASVQSLARPARRAELIEAMPEPRLVIVDEAHHAVADSYMAILTELGCWEDDPVRGCYALGVTATLGRSDRVALGQVWQEVVYRRDIIDMIKQGYLVNAKGIRVKIEGLDLRQVARSRGDWRSGDLGDAMHAALAPAAVARAYVDHAKDRQGLLFAPTVEMAYEMAGALRDEGIEAQGLDGTTPMADRRDLLGAFARGDVQVVANCMVLTEGFDAPWCSAVVIARPTSSAPLFIQMAGRGLRPYPGKSDALILDVAGVTGRHRLASVVDLVGAERVEKLPDDLDEYEGEIDLLGLDDVLMCAGGVEPPDYVDGPLTHEVVDLFGVRRQAWLRTHRGVWFLSPDRESLVFLAPESEPGRYAVARCGARGGGGEFLVRMVDLDMAMTWGEQHAGGYARKGAQWRNSPISQQQMVAAANMHVSIEQHWRRGELSDALSVQSASWTLDRMPLVSTVSQRGYW